MSTSTTEPRILCAIPETQSALGGLSRSTIWRLIAAEQLVAVRIGGRTMITAQSIAELVERAPRVGRRRREDTDARAA